MFIHFLQYFLCSFFEPYFIFHQSSRNSFIISSNEISLGLLMCSFIASLYKDKSISASIFSNTDVRNNSEIVILFNFAYSLIIFSSSSFILNEKVDINNPSLYNIVLHSPCKGYSLYNSFYKELLYKFITKRTPQG